MNIIKYLTVNYTFKSTTIKKHDRLVTEEKYQKYI